MKLATVMLASTALCVALSSGALADTKDKKIAFSNNYAGNSWRQAMLKSYDVVTKKAVADGVVAAADVFTTADKEVPTQAAQIQNLILQGYDAIVINASSPDALNGADQAGLRRRHRRRLLRRHRHRALRLARRRRLQGHGQAGSRADGEVPAEGRQSPRDPRPRRHVDRRGHPRRASWKASPTHPEFKIVSSVTGDWDQTTAQKAVATVLPSLPDIVGIVDQGGDGYGAAQAFAAAGKPRPTIIMGNRQDELQWWKEQKEKDGYTTWSASIAPGVSTLAFWVAQQILDGNKDVPHDLLVPYLAFTQDDFEAALPTIEKGSVASHEYTQDDAHGGDQGQHEVIARVDGAVIIDARLECSPLMAEASANIVRSGRRRKAFRRRPCARRRRFRGRCGRMRRAGRP